MNQTNKEKKSSKRPDGIVDFEDLTGYIKTVTAIPSYKPRNINQQMRIYVNSLTAPTTKRLYIYSFEAKIWNYITLT